MTIYEASPTVLLASLVVGVAIVYAAYQLFPKKKKYCLVGRIESLWIYPIKSCTGIKIDEAQCTKLGFGWNGFFDRHWAVSTSNGTFVTQRQEPRMALIEPSWNGNLLQLDAPGMEPICFEAFPEPNEKNISSIKIWDEVSLSVDVGDEIGKWFSTYLKRDGLRMHFCAPSLEKRECSQAQRTWKYAPKAGDLCAFSDDTGYMILSQKSIDHLNTKLENPVTVLNFRPNILLNGHHEAFAEDKWTHVQIGDAAFRALDNCTRCIFTTIDPKTGVKDKNGEPLATLKKFRCLKGPGSHPCFGVYHTLDQVGTIKVGDPVYALSV